MTFVDLPEFPARFPRSRLCFAAGALAVSLTACANTPGEEEPAPRSDAGEIFYNPVDRSPGDAGPTDPVLLDAGSDVIAMLQGAWSNADQYAFAPEDLKRPPAADASYDWLDLQYAEFHPVSAPEIGEHVAYLEWRSGGLDGEISRQRLWAFREDADGALAGVDFYTFKDPAPFAGRGSSADAFAALTEADLVAYPDRCILTARQPAWTSYVLQVRSDDCTITAQSGQVMGVDTSIEIAPDRVSYREAGMAEDGSYVFRVPGGPAYDFRRTDD